jgi:hypothetical protein
VRRQIEALGFSALAEEAFGFGALVHRGIRVRSVDPQRNKGSVHGSTVALGFGALAMCQIRVWCVDPRRQ